MNWNVFLGKLFYILMGFCSRITYQASKKVEKQIQMSKRVEEQMEMSEKVEKQIKMHKKGDKLSREI